MVPVVAARAAVLDPVLDRAAGVTAAAAKVDPETAGRDMAKDLARDPEAWDQVFKQVELDRAVTLRTMVRTVARRFQAR